MRTKRKGFTLIELLVVIAIIGVMAALVIVNLSSANKKSRDARRKSDLSQISKALELYYDDLMYYPTQATRAAVSGISGSLTPNYIKTLPQDPRNTGANIYYYLSANGNSYTLEAQLENSTSVFTVYSSN
jgi:general secretion pathway protein G